MGDSDAGDIRMDATEPEHSATQNNQVAAIDLSPDQDGGILKEIVREGTVEEKPVKGDKVKVHYVGTLLDGTPFDSSRDRKEKFEFDLGKGKVIKAWDIGVATMKKGEICRLTCHPKYAYGETGSPPKISPNSTLIFEIELFEWKGEDVSPKKDGGIIRNVLSEGTAYSTPNDGASVKAHITGHYNNEMFEDRDVEFILGEGSEHNVIDGIEIALKKFKKEEKSKLKIKGLYAFGKEGCSKYGVPPNADVEYEVYLKDFEKAKESWEMDAEEKMQQSELIKAKGTTYFKAEKFSLAANQYKRIVDYLKSETDLESEQKEERNSLVLAAHLNLAMCYLKINDCFKAIKECDDALGLEPNSEKGYFRRGQAYAQTSNFEEAKKDFLKVLEINQGNKTAKYKLKEVQGKIKDEIQKERKKYKGMFTKFAEEDKQKEGKKLHGIPADKKIGEWENKMADGMMPLHEEAAAFGEDVRDAGSGDSKADI